MIYNCVRYFVGEDIWEVFLGGYVESISGGICEMYFVEIYVGGIC